MEGALFARRTKQNGVVEPIEKSTEAARRRPGALSQVAEGTRTTGHFYGADGRFEHATDAIGRSVSFVRDADGRVSSTTLPDGRVVAASYDPNSNLLTLTPPGRPAHSFSYTSRDLTQQYTPPTVTPGAPTPFAYNPDSQ